MNSMYKPKVSVAAQLQLKVNDRRSKERQDILPKEEQKSLDVFLTEDTLREKYKGTEIMSEVGVA